MVVAGGAAASQCPVGSFAGAAEFTGACGIQQKCACPAIVREFGPGTSLAKTEDFYDRKLLRDGGAGLRSLVAVQLRRGQTQGLTERDDWFRGPIYKDADRSHIGRKSANHVGRIARGDAARALGVKVQADGVGAEVGSEFAVGGIGYAPVFYRDLGNSFL